jgi:calcineurin-like phosphoesterase family protein
MLKIKLYPCFNKWLEFNNIWIFSDPHFNDPEMVYLRKNYISDEEQVKRINARVGKKDLLICLGDCGDLSFISQLRAGYKVLIKGNHDDKGDSYYQREIIERFSNENMTEEDKAAYASAFINGDKEACHRITRKYTKVEDNRLFDEVYSGPIWITEKVLLSHEPIDLPYAFNIHGHDHSNWFDNGHHLNLCAEHIDYTPVSLLKLIKDGTFSKVDNIHRMTIDKATEKKLKKL